MASEEGKDKEYNRTIIEVIIVVIGASVLYWIFGS